MADNPKRPPVVPVTIPNEVLINLTVPELKAELKSRDAYFPSNFRKQQLLDQLKTCMHLPVVKIVKAPEKRKKKTYDPLRWNEVHPARILLYNELKDGRIPLDANEMGPAEVYYNYSGSLEFQMEGMEFGDAFIRRLQELRKIVTKEQPEPKWNETHPARALLYNELKEGTIPLDETDMGPAEVYCTYNETMEFQLRGMEYSDKFVRRLRGLREIVQRDTSRAAEDKKALEIALKNHPPPVLNHRGQPQWNGSVAQAMLEVDIAAGRHTRMVVDKCTGRLRKIKPSELWAGNEEYMRTLSKDQFRWKIRQVVRTKKHLHTLKHRANEKLRAHMKDMPKDVLEELNLA